jgi:glycerophosphoryl diester phosphodiesterase
LEIIAHRGACFGAPENSLAAFELAIAQGAPRVELDVRVSADGVPFVVHDEATGRTGDRDLVVASTRAADLAEVRLPNGEPLPTLADACALLAGRAELDLEIKAAQPADMPAILGLLERTGLARRVLITAFDEPPLLAVRAAGFRGRTGLLIGSRSMKPAQRLYEGWPLRALRRVRATELVTHHKLVHPALRVALRSENLGLVLWSAVEDEVAPAPERAAMYLRAARSGATGFIVGRVAEALRVLGQAASQPPTP